MFRSFAVDVAEARSVFVVRMIMVVAVVMTVMFETGGRPGQLSGEIGGDENLNARFRRRGAHRDAVLGEEVKRAFANAAGDHHLHAQIAKPSGEQAGLMRRGGYKLSGQHEPVFRIGIHERKFAAVSEMAV